MPAALDLLTAGAAMIGAHFGATACSLEGFGAIAGAQWNDLGRTEELEINGRRVTFSAVVEIPRAAFPGVAFADLLALAGRKITHTETGKTFRIVGEVAVDELSVRFPVDSVHK